MTLFQCSIPISSGSPTPELLAFRLRGEYISRIEVHRGQCIFLMAFRSFGARFRELNWSMSTITGWSEFNECEMTTETASRNKRSIITIRPSSDLIGPEPLLIKHAIMLEF
jgi:hypothetical protein